MTYEIRVGHVLNLLQVMPAESVHCVVTSPPYFGLRSYKTDPQVWGGELEHPHDWKPQDSLSKSGGDYGISPEYNKNRKVTFSSCSCSCGAWCGELGLEPTYELYVQHLVEVFREVRRVLRKDGTLWLNMGDSYAGSAQGWSKDKVYAGAKQATNKGSINRQWIEDYGYSKPPGYISSRQPNGLKPKDLAGVPWRVAFALQADGWWLRSDIIWAKPNPMPESVTDRPTKSHEYVFLLTKSAQYFYDAEAIKEHSVDPDNDRGARTATEYKRFPTREVNGICASGVYAMRNARTVWTIPTQPFSDAHFATFPEKLVEPCIRAGTSEKRCCAACGAPWKREVKLTFNPESKCKRTEIGQGQRRGFAASGIRGTNEFETIGWHPTCSCQAETIPCTVFDPFVGSGTTGVVALKLSRSFLGLELQPAYVEMARKRIGAVMPLFAEATCDG